MRLSIESPKIAHTARSATGLGEGSYFALSRLLRSHAQAQPHKGAVFVPFLAHFRGRPERPGCRFSLDIPTPNDTESLARWR